MIVSLDDSGPIRKIPQDRRLRILRAAVAIAGHRGHDAVTMRVVACQAAVSMGTLYRYFPSKDLLLVAVRREGLTACVVDPPRVRTH